MLEGSLVIRYEDEEHRLEVGDSVYFDATQPLPPADEEAHPGVDRDGAATNVVETVFS